MATKQVFEISEIVPDKDKCLVRGRAYDDLQVGDTVFVEGQQTGDDRRYSEFEIAGILTYQTEVQFLDGDVTGQLTLKGPNLELLRGTTHLLKFEKRP